MRRKYNSYRCIRYRNSYHTCRCPECVRKRKERRLAEQERARVRREKDKLMKDKLIEARRRAIERARRKLEIACLKKSKAPYLVVFEAGVREMRAAFNRKLDRLFE